VWRLLGVERGEQHAPPLRRRGRERAPEGYEDGDGRGVVVRAVIDVRPAPAEVVVVGADDDPAVRTGAAAAAWERGEDVRAVARRDRLLSSTARR
jgi:hypothetical protein